MPLKIPSASVTKSAPVPGRTATPPPTKNRRRRRNRNCAVPSKTFPKEVKTDPDLDALEFSDIEIFIRALDRDKTESGWSAIIPSLSPKRIKLKVSSKIDLIKLASKESIIGSGIAEYEKLEGDKRRYKEYILTNIK